MKKLFSILFFLIAFATAFSQQKRIIDLPTASSNGAGSYMPVTKDGVTKKLLTDSLARLAQKPIHFTGPLFDVSNDSSVTIREVAVDSIAKLALPYKIYVVALTQSGTSAPTAVVFDNTLGVLPTLTRSSAGVYLITIATGLFTTAKLYLPGTGMARVDNNNISITTLSGGTSTDGILNNTPFEIRVYK